MIFNRKNLVLNLSLIIFLTIGCKDGNSVYDPDYEPSRPDPVITNITPAGGYLAGVDSVIIYGENFASIADSITVNFGGSPGVIKKATEDQLIVRPGTISGDLLDVRVSVRGAEFFSNTYNYTLFEPFGTYFGLTTSDNPTSALAIDADNNVYTIINNGGVIRYTKIDEDGAVTTDLTRYPGEVDDNKVAYPVNNTMRFTSYSAMLIGPDGNLFLAQQSIRAIFTKTFGDGLRESVWGASSSSALKIKSMVFDNNGYLWVVGSGSNNIHRFTVASKSETKIPFDGDFSAVAFNSTDSELFVGGLIDSTQQVWKFTIDGNGDLINPELYFDLGQYNTGTVSSLIVASNGELLIATGNDDASILRVFPDGRYEPLFEGMLKSGAYSITWRDDEFAVVAISGEDESSINFLNMYDRTRAGIYGF